MKEDTWLGTVGTICQLKFKMVGTNRATEQKCGWSSVGGLERAGGFLGICHEFLVHCSAVCGKCVVY